METTRTKNAERRSTDKERVRLGAKTWLKIATSFPSSRSRTDATVSSREESIRDVLERARGALLRLMNTAKG